MGTTHAVRRKYNLIAKIYDWIYAGYLSKTIRSACQALALRGDEKILDIGCGTGELEKALIQKNPALSITGVDISTDMLEIARKKFLNAANVTFQEGDFLKIALPDETFDAAFSLSNLHYFPNPQAILQKTNRHLKKGGKLIIVDWNRGTFKGKFYNFYMRLADPSFIKIYTRDEIATLLEKSGFIVEKVDYFGVGIAWAMMCVVARKG